jgi:hypothetical protein
VNVSNDSCIDKVDECVIYELAINRTRVEDGEVGIFNAWGMEVRVREGAGVQSHAIDGISLLATSLDGHTISNRDVANILSHLSLSLLVAEEQLVMHWVSAVIEHPVIARVVSVLLCLYTRIDDTELRGSSDKEHWCFISRTFMVGVNEIDKGWYPSEVNNLVIALETTWRIFSTRSVGKSVDGWHQIIGPNLHGV